MRVRIPVSSDLPHFSQKVDLDGLPFALALQWRSRARRWTLSLLDELEGQVFSAGRPITAVGPWMDQEVLNQLSVRRFRRIYDLTGGRLPGMLYAVSSAPLAGVREDLDNLSLVYADASEVRPWLVTP